MRFTGRGFAGRVGRGNRSADDAWFRAVSRPEKYGFQFKGIQLPAIAEESDQLRYTGLQGQRNMEQAYSFYRYAYEQGSLGSLQDPRVMDFGAGWGRVIRFFLKDTPASNLYAVDVMDGSIELMRSLHLDVNLVKSDPFPPLQAFHEQSLDLIYAASVFSHLSEDCFLAWARYFRTIVAVDGRFVFSSRGPEFLAYLKQLVRTSPRDQWPNFLQHMGDLDEVQRRYQDGDHVYVASGGGDELTSDFFGEAYVSASYLERVGPEIGFCLERETTGLDAFDQNVFTMRPC